MKRTFGPLLTTFLAYTALGLLGIALAIPPGYASPVFPAAGLAVALVLYFGNRILPGIWLGSLTINIVIAWQTGGLGAINIVIAGVVAGGAVLQAFAAHWMILRLLGDKWRSLETEKDIMLFLVAGGPLSCFISATIGNCTLYVAGVIPTKEEFFHSWCNWWTGDVLGVLIFTPLILLFLFRKKSPWKERRLTITLPMMLTLCLVIVAFLGTSHRQKTQQIGQVEECGRNIAQLLEHRFVAHQEALSALKRLIEVMPDMTFLQFEYFTGITLQDNKDIFALSFNPYVLDSSRSAFEQTMAKSAMDSFRIRERNSQNQLAPAPEKPFYIPVGLIAPLEGNRPAIGFNIHSEPTRRDAIEKAFLSKCSTVTAPIQLVQEAKKRLGVLILTPAYRRGESPANDGMENLIGFAVGVFKIDEMVQIAIQDKVPAGIVFRLTDQSPDGVPVVLFQSDGGQQRPTEPYVWRKQLSMVDRQWTLEVFPTEAYLQQQQSSFGWVVGIAGLLVATLLQILLLAMTGRTSVIQQKVNEQTAQLTEAFAAAQEREQEVAEKKEELELVIEGTRLGTWSWNIPSGKVSFNQRWAQMLGYDLKELDGTVDTWKALIHPEDLDMVIHKVQSHIQGETSLYVTEHRLRHKSGKWVWVYDTGKVLKRDPEGKPLLAIGIHLDITERKEAQQELAKAKEEADTIIRKFLDTLIVVQRNLLIARVNPATCQLLGYEESELIGKPITMLFHDPYDLVKSVFSFYEESQKDVFNGRTELRNIELSYQTKDGSLLPMSVNISLLKDEAGLIVGVIAGAKDISNLKIAMDTVASQKEYIEHIFDIVPQGLLTLTQSMEIVESNKAFNEIIQTWSTLFSLPEQDFSTELLGKLQELLTDTSKAVFTLSHNNISASFKYHATSVSARAGIKYVVAISDITNERKDAAARKLLATVIEQTPDTVVLTDIDGTIRYVNPATISHTGYSEGELIGKNPRIFQSGLTPVAVYNDLWQTILDGRVWSGHISNRKKDGSIIEENMTISPVRNEDGDLTHFVAIRRDITAMVLLQRQLLQAQKLEAIGQLAAGIAHEINTPMQYVRNNVSFFERAFADFSLLLTDYLQLQDAQGDLLTEEARSHLKSINLEFLMAEIPDSIEEIQDGIARVVKIISAMKEFSHPGSGEKIAIDLNRALESTIVVTTNEWKYVAEMVTDLDPNLPMVPCLSDQLNQVMLNLIVNGANAIEETGASYPDNPGRISISTRQDNDWVEIRVSDTGGGIPEELRNKIFEPFFTTKEVGKGTGQGLAISQDVVVVKHGGTLDFISDPGKGTTFVIRLPLNPVNNEVIL
ncbi:MAG: PAS domain S-box protein [Desulfobulbaceae bacterium]|nr:PAS domain S-box protein [Desulfobulbaceae bacterium]